MDAITKRFVLPVYPVNTKVKSIYPWETDYFALLYAEIYQRAKETGYNGTLEEFRSQLGDFLSKAMQPKFYNGQYEVTPLAHLEQILRTEATILERDIVVGEIPYYETSNAAGGYTVIIG